jgi:VWFA-related protein
LKRRHLLAFIVITQLASGSFAQQPAASPTATPPPLPQTVPQQPQKPEDVEIVRITTNLVQVDAVVTDKNGKVVTDLKPEELEIFEDGRKQKITHFSYNVADVPALERSASPVIVDKNAPPVPPTRLKSEDIRRTIAVVVDDLGLSFESTYYVRRALKKFVDEQMQPGDLVAIIRTGGGMGALQQFTADKRQLYAAIERVKWNSLGRGGVSAFAAMTPPSLGEGGAEIDALTEEQTQARDETFSVGTLGAISYVVRGLKELPGRKSILLVSDGFKISSLEDPTQTNQSLLPRAPRNNLAANKLGRLIEEANRASVVIYTMNATGLQTLGLTAADNTGDRSSSDIDQQLSNRRNTAYENQEGLDVLARETGGIAIHNTNDLSRGIRRVLEDQRGFYLIGYRPDSSTFDPRTGRRTFHKLSLKVLRPGKFNVRMRNGFYGVSDEDRRPVQRTLAQQLVGALTSPFGATGVHLQLTSLFANDAKFGSFMRSVLHIDGRDLTFTDEPDKTHKCVFDVLAMTFGDNGTLVDQPTGRTYTLQFPDELYKRVLRDGLVYYVTVPIKKPGAYQLRLSLRDSATERIGSANQFIEVPDLKKDRLAISGVVVRGTSASSRNTGTSANANPGESQEGVEQGNAEASPAVRHFARGMFMDYVFVIYNAHVDKSNPQPRMTTQVRLFRGSALVFNGKENPYNSASQTDLKRLVAGGEIQLGTDLVPGEYTLQIVVNDLLADQKHRTVTQWMDFEIVK